MYCNCHTGQYIYYSLGGPQIKGSAFHIDERSKGKLCNIHQQIEYIQGNLNRQHCNWVVVINTNLAPM